MSSEKALAILNMLLFVIIFTILSGVILMLTSTQTRLMEHHIRRIKANYASEAANVVARDALRRGVAIATPVSIEWVYGDTSPIAYKQAVIVNQVISSEKVIFNSFVDYSTNW